MINTVNPKIAIYVATHNQAVDTSEDIFIPIQTGASLSKQRFCTICDNTGANISDKNRTFCELTALYWIWKNDAHAIVGLSHYRRHFIINSERILACLKDNDLITPFPYYFRNSLREEYERYHIGSDLTCLYTAISELSPSTESVLNRILKGNRLIPYNMLIAPHTLLVDYCEWLFPILFRIESLLNLRGRDFYQARVFGFLSERLFTAYIEERKLQASFCPVSIPEMSTPLRHIKYYCGLRYNQLYFKWTKRNE